MRPERGSDRAELGLPPSESAAVVLALLVAAALLFILLAFRATGAHADHLCSPGAPIPPAGPGAGGCGMDAISIDFDTTGNSQSAVGAIEPCVGNVSPGSSVTLDVTAQGVAPYTTNGTHDVTDDSGGIIAYQFNLAYDPAFLTITAVTDTSSSINLLFGNPGSSQFWAGDVLPDSDGNYNATALDTGIATPESGSGVLERITVTISPDTPAGQYNLLMDPLSTIHLDVTGAAYLPDAVNGGAIAVGQACGAIPTFPPTPGPTPRAVVVNPIADAYVAAEPPFSRWNYGRASDLRSDSSPLRETYLGFDLRPFAGDTILSASLRMFVTNGSGGVHNVNAVSNAWGEDWLYWTNRPEKGATVATFTPGTTAGVWRDVDVTSGVAPLAGQYVSLAIDTASSDAFHFNSREAAANRVELFLEIAPFGTTPPPAPSPTPVPTPTTSASAISFQGSAITANSTASVDLVIPKPPGTTAGDVLVASLAINGPGVWLAPPGWVQIAAVTGGLNPKLFAYYRVAESAEPDNYTWLLNGAVASSGGIARYTGVDTTNPLDTPSSTASSSVAVPSIAVAGVTTTRPGTMLVGAAAVNSSKATVAMSAPAGLTTKWDLEGKRQTYADGALAVAGNSGAKTWTFSSAREAAAWLAALRPAQD
jgi:hypothetical protein